MLCCWTQHPETWSAYGFPSHVIEVYHKAICFWQLCRVTHVHPPVIDGILMSTCQKSRKQKLEFHPKWVGSAVVIFILSRLSWIENLSVRCLFTLPEPSLLRIGHSVVLMQNINSIKCWFFDCIDQYTLSNRSKEMVHCAIDSIGGGGLLKIIDI